MKPKPPINESKHEKFKRLATLRTNEVIKRIRILGNCAYRGAYDYSEDEVNKIFSEIDKTTKETKTKFHFPKNREFKL